MEVWKEIAKLEANVDVLKNALYNYKAADEGFEKNACAEAVERQIANTYYTLQQLSNQFSVANINEHLLRMNEESEGGGD